ncbi:ABC transporter ATP-binding protein [Candidatus Gracilibacteria bacterium 28_42_T64]|nr:ABC transporter ATP-binding protein [Candidatus Gracilibacteria bacterium 28_42_T64]
MHAIKIKKLVKKYGKLEVLKKIDLEVEKGDFFALLGHNGAGKTTIISILTNLVNKNSGKIEINGIDIDTDFKKARSYIGVVPQEFNFDIFSKVQDIPLIQAGYYGIDKKTAAERTEKYMKKLGLWEKRDVKARELSGGMKRRLMIVRALVHEPEILILDEPTAGVDVELRKSMWEFIEGLNKAGTTIILTTHYLEEVEALCKNVAIMHKGVIVENTSVKNLLSQLKKETIILSTSNENIKLDAAFKRKYSVKLHEDNEIELEISQKHSLNELFKELDKAGIEVTSFRNKTNRLEALFMKLLK